MLVELHIANYALIDELSLSLGPGFTVLTGETGAGKSIILDALGLLLGDRADGAMVRSGAERAVIEGIFELSRDVAEPLGTPLEADVAADGLILSREITAAGRSIARVNGSAVPLRKLAEAGALIVDIHGQGEHLSLLRPSSHLELLDRYGDLRGVRAEFAAVVRRLASVRREMFGIRRDQEELAAREQLLSFQVAEIEAARLAPGEEEVLVGERTLRLNAERAVQLAEEAARALEPDEPGAAGAIELAGAAARALAALEKFDPAMAEHRRAAESAALELEELVRAVRRFADGVEYDQRRLDEISERLEVIGSLKRKYGGGVEEVLAYAHSASEELQRRETGGQRLEALEGEEAALREHAGQLASRLFSDRLEAAGRLASAVEKEVRELGMEQARLAVAFRHDHAPDGLATSGVFDALVESEGSREPGEASEGSLRFGPSGVDSVEFLIAANPGEPLRPLSSTASGGETSRLMLAIKGALAQADPVPVLIFDEIDAGIGGRVGEVVGRRLWALGRSHQVLAVTHLPQIASCADRHISVRKVVEGGRTYTRVKAVGGGERIKEIGSMLGSESEATLAKAAELLERSPG